jgi:hypothetical protein
MLHQNNEPDDLDDWEKEDEEKYEEENASGSIFPVKKQSIEEKAFKEEIERTNQQTVNDLFKVNNNTDKLPSIKNDNPSIKTANTNSNAPIKTKTDYINYAKECSNKMKSNKATSISILTFCKNVVDENCLRISAEHLEDLLEHIHKLKESKLFKPINKAEQIKVQKQSQQNHEEVFGDCTRDFDEDHLRIESKY